MNQIYHKKDSYRFWLSFFFIFGSVLGTVFCNALDAQMKSELGSLESSLLSAPALRRLDFLHLLFQVLAKRIPALLAVFLMELTPIAPVLFQGVAAWIGFSTAVTVSALTMQAGLFGIVDFLALLFPHYLLYIPAAYILLLWIPEHGAGLRPLPAVILLAAVVIGAAAEAFVNPWVAAAIF